jgi:hypothetical protein
MARLHELIGEQLGEDADDAEVIIGTETDRGPWVAALVAAGYTVYGVNPLQASRYRERHGVSGAKSDTGDAHMLTDMVRTDSHQLRVVAGDSPGAGAVKVVARAHKTLIWERARQVQRLRHQLREYFPAALEAFADLDAPDALELLARAPDPARAAKLTRAQLGRRRAEQPGVERHGGIKVADVDRQLDARHPVTSRFRSWPHRQVPGRSSAARMRSPSARRWSASSYRTRRPSAVVVTSPHSRRQVR